MAMKRLLSTLCIALLSFNNSSFALVDPDSLDPSMSVVSYLISSENLEITAYHLGSPSKLTVKLCKICNAKTYLLDPRAKFKIFNQPLNKTKLTEILLKKEFTQLRLAINRSKGMITYLYIGASPNDELSLAPFLNANNPSHATNHIKGAK
jgi:hypothetical protein